MESPGRPRPGPGPGSEGNQEAFNIFQRNISQMELSDKDKEVLGRASMKFITYANIGLWTGSVLGCAFAFRKRWGITSMGFIRTSTVKPSGVTETVVKYYPKLGEAGAGAAKDTAPGVPNDKLWLLVRGMALGLMGGMIGGQIGAIMGKKAASRVMEEDGGGLKERLKVALDKTAKDLKELQARGGVPARPSLTSGGVVGVLAGSRSNNDNVEEANDPWARTSPSVDDEGSPSSISTQPEVSSKWEELRKSQATPPSSWDKLREASARPSLPDSKINEREDLDELKTSTVSDEDARSEKDKRKKYFEDLLERERQGGEDKRDKWSRSSSRPER